MMDSNLSEAMYNHDYLLSKETLAILSQNGSHCRIHVPAGAFVRVTNHTLNQRFVVVTWKSAEVLMFRDDMLNRCIPLPDHHRGNRNGSSESSEMPVAKTF
jgi:hypothetical protein